MTYTYKDTENGREVYRDDELLGVVEPPIKHPDARIVDMVMEDANFGNPQREALMACFGQLEDQTEQSEGNEQ